MRQGLPRPKAVRLFEDGAQDVKWRDRCSERRACGGGQIGQVEAVDLLGRVGEVGVDLEPIEVADNKQRRIVEAFAIFEELGRMPPSSRDACPCTPRQSGLSATRPRNRHSHQSS